MQMKSEHKIMEEVAKTLLKVLYTVCSMVLERQLKQKDVFNSWFVRLKKTFTNHVLLSKILSRVEHSTCHIFYGTIE